MATDKWHESHYRVKCQTTCTGLTRSCDCNAGKSSTTSTRTLCDMKFVSHVADLILSHGTHDSVGNPTCPVCQPRDLNTSPIRLTQSRNWWWYCVAPLMVALPKRVNMVSNDEYVLSLFNTQRFLVQCHHDIQKRTLWFTTETLRRTYNFLLLSYIILRIWYLLNYWAHLQEFMQSTIL